MMGIEDGGGGPREVWQKATIFPGFFSALCSLIIRKHPSLIRKSTIKMFCRVFPQNSSFCYFNCSPCSPKNERFLVIMMIIMMFMILMAPVQRCGWNSFVRLSSGQRKDQEDTWTAHLFVYHYCISVRMTRIFEVFTFYILIFVPVYFSKNY